MTGLQKTLEPIVELLSKNPDLYVTIEVHNEDDDEDYSDYDIVFDQSDLQYLLKEAD